MLEGLDKIHWKELEHAYGSAEDVPLQIRALASEDREIRKEAYTSLWSNIFHQGTVYSATSYAVPFLLELLEIPAVQDKPRLLIFLTALAFGNSYLVAHQTLFEEMNVFQEEMQGSEWQQQMQEELGWVTAAESAVVAGIPIYLKLLDDPDHEIRLCAAYALAVGRRRANEIIPRLQDRLKSEQDERVRMSILLSLGYLGGQELIPFLESQFDTTESTPIRTAAALSLARVTPQQLSRSTIQHLLAVLNDPQPVDDLYVQLPWSEDESVVSAICTTVGSLGSGQAERIIPPMLDALTKLRVHDTGSIDMVGTILSLAFEAEQKPRQAEDLTGFQREVLLRLAHCDRAWDWGNVLRIFTHFGLPGDRKKLAELCGETWS